MAIKMVTSNSDRGGPATNPWVLSLVVLVYLIRCDTCEPFQRGNVQRTRAFITQHSPPSTQIFDPSSHCGTYSACSIQRTFQFKRSCLIRSETSLKALVDAPEGFFTITFASLGLTLSIAKSFARIRMEENAWEQRLAEARRERLMRDPSVTELDLRRQEAAMEWSAYGKPRVDEEQQRRQREADKEQMRGGRKRVKVMEQDAYQMKDGYDDDDDEGYRSNRMTDEEIEAFEIEYGIDYDPYYDDPYTEEELPIGNFRRDKTYGDRTYENGETFFKDKATGLYYRQGAKPRNVSFWS